MLPEVALVLQLAVGLIFLSGALQKLRSPARFAQGVAEYGLLPPRTTTVAAYMVIGAEAWVGMSHLSGWRFAVSVYMALSLLVIFLGAVLAVLARGTKASCLCFGVSDDDEVSPRSAARIVAMLAAETFLLVALAYGPERPMPYALSSDDVIPAGLVALCALIAASWLFSVPEISAALAPCTGCSRRSRKQASATPREVRP